MRILAAFVVAFLMGITLGKWGPHRDYVRVLEELKTAKQKSGSRGTSLGGVGRMLNIQPDESRTPRVSVGTNTVETADAQPGDNEPRQRRRRPDNLREQLDQAKELWQARVDLARDSFLFNLGGSPEVARDFDVLVAALNLKIAHNIDQWVEAIKSKEDVRPEDMARLFHNLTGDIVTTYDEMDRKLPEGWRDGAGKDFMLYDFVDPSVGEKFIEIESLMKDSETRFQ